MTTDPSPDREPPYRIVFTVTEDAAIDASRFAGARMWRLMAVAALLIVACGLIATFLDEPAAGVGLLAAGALLALTSVWRAPTRWLLRRRSRSAFGTRLELSIGDTGLDVTSAHASGHRDWTGLTEVREGRKSVLFMRDRLAVAYAPLEAFGTPARRHQILAYARAKMASGRAVT
jgi:hypothetical protein